MSMYQSRCLVYVGQDSRIVESLRTALSDDFYRIETVTDPVELFNLTSEAPSLDAPVETVEALDRRFYERYSVALLDLDEPDEQTVAILRELKKREPATAVVVLLDGLDLTGIALARQAGADGALVRPLESFDRLVEVLQQAFGKTKSWETSLRTAFRDLSRS